MSIQELNIKEQELYNSINLILGRAEDMENAMVEKGIYHQYDLIYNEYCELIVDPLVGVEALKRALFLQWYSVSEPNYLTGICINDAERQNMIIRQVIKLFIEEKADEELKAMLYFYYSISDWYFIQFEEIKDILTILQANFNNPIPNIVIGNNRGQMIHYWNSLERE